MLELEVQCLYCGFRFEERVWSQSGVADIRCPKCKGREVKAKQKDPAAKNIYGYED